MLLVIVTPSQVTRSIFITSRRMVGHSSVRFSSSVPGPTEIDLGSQQTTMSPRCITTVPEMFPEPLVMVTVMLSGLRVNRLQIPRPHDDDFPRMFRVCTSTGTSKIT